MAAKTGTKFTRDGLQCDLSTPGETAFEQFTDMLCIWKGYTKDAQLPGGAGGGSGGRHLETVLDFANLVRTRLRLYEALEGDPNRFGKMLASSALTDRFSAWEPMRRTLLSVANVRLPTPVAQRRRTQSALQLCPAGQQYCP